MKKSAPSTCSAESAGSALDLKEPDLFGQLPSVSKTPTPSASLKSTGPTRPFTTMSEPSQQMDLEELTSSVAGSLASRGPLPGSSEAQKMTAISGRKWLGLLKSYGLTGSLAKTCEALLTSQWGSSAAFLTWRGSGTAPSHLLFQLAPSMPRTAETECGLSPRKMAPTPTASDHIERTSTSTEAVNPLTGKSVSLDRFVKFWPDQETQESGVPKLWPTPRSCSAMAAENIQNRAADEFPNLESVVARSLWPTPTTPTGGGERSGDRVGTGNLHYMARSGQLWATPQARDHMPAHKPEYIAEKKAQGHGMRNLNDEVKMWPTPAARDYRYPNAKPHHERRPDKITSGEQLPNFVGGSLNPTWVEWLMGFPTGWTDLNALETPSSRKSSSKSDGQSSQGNNDER